VLRNELIIFIEVKNMVKTKCEVYSRVVGYIRPVSNWNDSKQAEFSDRQKFDSAVEKKCDCE
jgi:ribonucleoside-triphosphate reductase